MFFPRFCGNVKKNAVGVADPDGNSDDKNLKTKMGQFLILNPGGQIDL